MLSTLLQVVLPSDSVTILLLKNSFKILFTPLLKAQGLPLLKRFELWKKLHTSKKFLKMSSGRTHTPHPNSLDPFLAIIYGNHRKSLAYFSHLAPLILFFFTNRRSQKGAWYNASPPSSCWENIFELSIVTAVTACPFLMRSPQSLTNICGFSTKNPVIFRTLCKK